MAEVKIASFDYAGVMITIWAYEDADGNVCLRIDSAGSTTSFDLNGIFIDYGNDGGSMTSVGSKANNMNGADSEDGTKFDGFDEAYALGSIGGKDANYTDGTIKLAEGVTLAMLDGAEIGLRIQGVESLGGGSLKLGEIAEVPDDAPPPATDHFPDFKEATGSSISHVTFYFDTPDGFVGDTSGGPDDPDTKKVENGPDGWFTVKFDEIKDEDGNDIVVSDDLDDWYDAALAFILEQNPTLDPNTITGVSIKGGQSEIWYDLDNDPNDDDDAPDGLNWPTLNKDVDQSYDVIGNDPYAFG